MNEIGALVILAGIGVVLSALGAAYLYRGRTARPWGVAAGITAASIGIGLVVYAILQATLDEGQVGLVGALVVVAICAALAFYGEQRQGSARR